MGDTSRMTRTYQTAPVNGIELRYQIVPNGGHLSLVAEGLSDQFVVTAGAFLRGEWQQI